jgi:Carboxypeptidase regulatory-like domain
VKIVKRLWILAVGLPFLLLSSTAQAQFSSNVVGVVTDPSSAAVAAASVSIVSLDTGVSVVQKTDANGNFRFSSLAPGQYRAEVVAQGFSQATLPLTLTTNETKDLPIKLAISGDQRSVVVTGQAPALDTADSRLQLTLESNEIHAIPLPGDNFMGLTALAPGVEGLGVTIGTNPTANSSGLPSQVPDNFATELPVDASANGRSILSNMFIVDGLDVTSNITGGTTNLSPNPDSIQEFTIQTNTFDVEYGRSGSIIATSTTKSGTEKWHGSAADTYTYQNLWARTEFSGPTINGFKSNNMSGTIGGPIIPHRQSYFFFAIEPLRSTFSTGNQLYTFEDPQFVQWAGQNYPNTVGSTLLQKYPVKPTQNVSVAATANDIFPGLCGTPAESNIPCSLAMVDSGTYNASPYRNALQFNTRIDQYWGKDRLYGNYYRMTHNDQTPSIRTQMDTTNRYETNSLQVNETHTFTPNLLNEGMFGFLKVEGYSNQSGPFSVPQVAITGQSSGIGIGFADGGFVQDNYRWRDVLSAVHGRHEFKVGYEGWHGDDLAYFATSYSNPSFTFNNLVDLVQDSPYSEANLSYNPLTGQPEPGQYFFQGTTQGVFVQDTWKVKPNLTLTLGLRFDDFGNPSPKNGTILSNFFLGAGATQAEKVGNGSAIQVPHVFNQSITAFSPRVGVAWDPGKQGKWVVRGGFGLYRDWPTLGVDENGLKGNPPGFILPTFLTGTTNPPIFALGTSNTYPFGFPYPALPPESLDSHGGLTGAQLAVGGIDANIKSPIIYTYVGSVQHELPGGIVASIGYTGSHAVNVIDGSYVNQFPGTDVNRFAGDLVTDKNVLTRLNPSFGSVTYTTNIPGSQYNAMILTFEKRLPGGRITASYTRSSSWDHGQQYPDQNNIINYWQPSAFDVPNRFSFTGVWKVPVPGSWSNRAVDLALKGWQLSGTAALQSGLPFTVITTAPFQPSFDAAGNVNGLLPGSGDFNADGYNYDYPNAPSSYKTATGHKNYVNGVLSASSFPIPALGVEGSEKPNRFRGPGYADVDAALTKVTPITEGVSFQFRFEIFDLFNRVNLNGLDSNLSDSTFGQSTTQFNPRWVELEGKIYF